MSRRALPLLLTVAVMLLASVLAYTGSWFRSPWDKAAHFLLYGLLAAALLHWLPRRHRMLAWVIPLGLAVLDESTQSLSPLRSPDVRDFAADAAGIALAVVRVRAKRP